MSELCRNLEKSRYGTVQEVASIIGLMNSYAKAVDYGDNHIKKLEIEKVRALKVSRGNFNAHMKVSDKGAKRLKMVVKGPRKET